MAVTVEQTGVVPAADGLGTDPQTTGSLRDREHDDRPMEMRDLVRDKSGGCPRMSKFRAAAGDPEILRLP